MANPKEGKELKTDQNRIEINKRYFAKLDDMKLRIPKGSRERIKAYAESQGISANRLMIRALNADAKAHGYDLDIPETIKAGEADVPDNDNA